MAAGGEGEDPSGTGRAQPEGAERGERAGASGKVRVKWFQQQLGHTSTTKAVRPPLPRDRRCISLEFVTHRPLAGILVPNT